MYYIFCYYVSETNGFSNVSSQSWGNQVTYSLSQPYSAYEWFPCKQSLNDKIDSLEKERDEAKDQAIRKTAELENVIKRTQKEKYDIIEYANEKLLLKFLSIIDDLTNAVDSARQSHDATSILTGIEMIHQKALKLLEDEGVKPIDNVVGHPFDVHFHEALLSMPSEIKEGHVVQEVVKGYTLREKVIRHTKVVTSSGEPN